MKAKGQTVGHRLSRPFGLSWRAIEAREATPGCLTETNTHINYLEPPNQAMAHLHVAFYQAMLAR